MRSNWTPPKKKEVRTLSKREFVQQFVLSRAIGRPEAFDADIVAVAGAAAFEKIEKLCGGGK